MPDYFLKLIIRNKKKKNFLFNDEDKNMEKNAYVQNSFSMKFFDKSWHADSDCLSYTLLNL